MTAGETVTCPVVVPPAGTKSIVPDPAPFVHVYVAPSSGVTAFAPIVTLSPITILPIFM